MSDDDPVRLEAALVAEGPVDAVALTRVSGGWCARTSGDHTALLLDEGLDVVARFARPDDVDLDGKALFDAAQSAVSGDGQWAAFAGFGSIVLVDRARVIRWRASHPDLLSFTGDPLPGGVVFPPGGRHLWAFVPVAGKNDVEEEGAEYVERWVVDLRDGQVLSKARSSYPGWEIITHPAGDILGFGDADGHEQYGWWIRCVEAGEERIAAFSGNPVDVHADRTRWLAVDYGRPVVGRFAGGEPTRFYDVMDDYDPHDYRSACFASTDYVLAHRRHGEVHQHVLLDVRTLRPAGEVVYPSSCRDQERGVVGAQDGTWLTAGKGAPLRRWRLSTR